jgi:hypothetical protein
MQRTTKNRLRAAVCRDTPYHGMKKQTTITLDSETYAAGRRLAAEDRRTFSAELEFLIIAEAERRGISVSSSTESEAQPTGSPRSAEAVSAA